MTTPNIKALAEMILKIAGKEERIEVELASALLRLLEDSKNLAQGLRDATMFRDYDHESAEETLESHNKLMEELGSE